jgi:hypothetical protein
VNKPSVNQWLRSLSCSQSPQWITTIARALRAAVATATRAPAAIVEDRCGIDSRWEVTVASIGFSSEPNCLGAFLRANQNAWLLGLGAMREDG